VFEIPLNLTQAANSIKFLSNSIKDELTGREINYCACACGEETTTTIL